MTTTLMDDEAEPQPVLPPPTEEQDVALKHWVGGRSQVVSASAGAGKSTLLLHAAKRVPEDAFVIVLSYNKPLAVSMNLKLEKLRRTGVLARGVTAVAYTFHGLCSYLYGTVAMDDTTLEDTVSKAATGALKAQHPFTPTHVCVDEVQDMRPLHHRLLQVALPPTDVIYMLVGDKEQLLYDFEEPPASVTFLEDPESHFHTRFVFTRLSMSFRLTPPVAAFANAVSKQHGALPLVPGNYERHSPPSTRIISCSVWDWAKCILPIIQTHLQEGCPASSIGIIARNVRSSQPLLTLVNVMAKRGIPLYIHGLDGLDPKVRDEKICISTWHSSKGLQYDVVVVLGVDASSEPRPLHVALTRSASHLVCVMDNRSPNLAVLRAIDAGAPTSSDHATIRLVHRIDELPPPSVFTANGPRDLTSFSPRGSVVHDLHHNILDVGGTPPAECFTADHLVQTSQGTWEDVTGLYVDATLMCVEMIRTGVCLRLNEIVNPIRAPRQHRLARLLAGDRTRLVDSRLTNSDLLPEASWAAVAECTSCHPRSNDAPHVFAAAAAAAAAYNGFHHRSERLRDGRWVDDALFKAFQATCLATLPHSQVNFDVVLAREPRSEHERALYTRCHARSGSTAFTFVSAERLSAADRLRAVVPMAVSEEIDTCVLVNLRTGECQRLVLGDREWWAEKLQVA